MARQETEGTHPTQRTLKTVAGIPCYNVERFIGDVVTRARQHVDEVIAVDDGSMDGTAAVARAAGATVVTHERNMGYGAAIQSCFRAAREGNADVLVTLDGDRQHNPDEIPVVLAPLLRGDADLVIGSRFVPSTQQSQQTTATETTRLMPSIPPTQEDHRTEATQASHRLMQRYRKFGIDVITWVLNAGARTKISDAQSGFRAYGRSAVLRLMPTERSMAASVELLLEARKYGMRLAEVPISCIYHANSSTLGPVRHGLSVALAAVRLRLRSAKR